MASDPKTSAPSGEDADERGLARLVPLMQAWEASNPTLSRPIAVPLERCGEHLGVDLAAVLQAAAHVEPYVWVDGTRVWSLMQLARPLLAPGLRLGPGRLRRPPAHRPIHMRYG